MKKTIIWSTFAAAAVTAISMTGLFRSLELQISDRWYQERSASSGEIVLVGIDQKALQDIGPYQEWGRDVMAMVLENLNESEEVHPAAIGVDVIYAGETDPDLDEWLTEAAGQYGNVVMACAAKYGEKLVTLEDGTFYTDSFAVLGFDEAFDPLSAVTEAGHVNAMFDGDGVLRHHLLEIQLPDGRKIPSLALALAQKYTASQGMEEISLPPTDARGFWYVPFTGIPGDYNEEISVADILSGEIGADYFADKIVLIGPYAAGLQDSYITAADHAQPMFGVEFQANAVEALLRGNYKEEVPLGLQKLILFAVLAAAAFWFFHHKITAAVLAYVLSAGGYFALTKILYGQGLILDVFWVPVGLTVLFVGGIAWNYIRSAMEKRKVTQLFKRYVAPEIVNEILKEGTDKLNLAGNLTEIAVLFVDIRGFTTMSEKLKAPEVVEILNRYLTYISNCIFDNGGTLDKYVGDAVMAFWGAPIPTEDFALKAAKAALQMQQGADELAAEIQEQYGVSLKFGVGVHLGEAVVGNIGSPDRMDYTAIGDVVNTAARLEANAPGKTVYISEAVVKKLEGKIEAKPIPEPIHLKGKNQMLSIYTLEKILP